jgi:hypothetical protein
MRIKLKTIKYYGEPTDVYDHNYGKVHLFPNGTKREIKVLLLPSFKITIMIQESIIVTGCDVEFGYYAQNKWIYEDCTLAKRLLSAETIYLDNKLVKNKYANEPTFEYIIEINNAELDFWDEKNKIMYLKTKT